MELNTKPFPLNKDTRDSESETSFLPGLESFVNLPTCPLWQLCVSVGRTQLLKGLRQVHGRIKTCSGPICAVCWKNKQMEHSWRAFLREAGTAVSVAWSCHINKGIQETTTLFTTTKLLYTVFVNCSVQSQGTFHSCLVSRLFTSCKRDLLRLTEENCKAHIQTWRTLLVKKSPVLHAQHTYTLWSKPYRNNVQREKEEIIQVLEEFTFSIPWYRY